MGRVWPIALLLAAGVLAGCPESPAPPPPNGAVAPALPPAPAPPTEPAVPSTDRWQGLGAGSVLELETTSAGVKTRVRHVVLARDARTVLVRTEATTNGIALAAQVGTHSLGAGPLLEGAEEAGRELIETPAGKFEARKLRAGETVAWEAAGLPVFVRVESAVSSTAVTTVLVTLRRTAAGQ